MKARRKGVGAVRREQIVSAAMQIIADEGLQNLSLSAIEARTRMSRGQLMYYFRAKEDILLAVFDQLLQMMHDRARAGEGPCQVPGEGWCRLRNFLTMFLLTPPPAQLFHALQYTFLSQIGHRDDFRARLANLYEEWRQHMAGDIAPELTRRGNTVSSRTFATFVQAILHGLAMQRVADANAFDREEMLKLCVDLLGSYLGPRAEPNGHASTGNGRKSPRLPARAARKRQT